MRLLNLCVILGFCMFAVGCTSGPLNTKGIGPESNRYVLADSNKGVAIAGRYEKLKTDFETHSFTIIGIAGSTPNGYADFTAYLAPYENGVATGTIDDEAHALEFADGWVYCCGGYSQLNSRRVHANGSGTRVIVETTDTVDRVYLVPETGDHYVDIYPQVGSHRTPRHLADEGKYVTIDDDGVISTPTEVSGDQLRFVKMVRDAVISHGMPWPTFLGVPTWP